MNDKLSAAKLLRELQDVYDGDTPQATNAKARICSSHAALESDLATSEAAREKDIRVLANQALELERLQGIEARAKAGVSNAEDARERAEEVVSGIRALSGESDLGEFSKGVGLVMCRYFDSKHDAGLYRGGDADE